MNEIKRERIKLLDKLLHIFCKRISSLNAEMYMKHFKGVTSVELSIIGIVGDKPDVILKEISERISVPGSTLTNAVDRLENRSLLTRVISKRDRRSFKLKLTEAGKRLYEEHAAAEQQMWGKVLGALESDEEIDTFLRLLKKVVEGIK